MTMKTATALLLLILSASCFAQAPKVVDRKFVALSGTYFAAGMLDSELTQLCIRGGTCVEGNGWMPKSQVGQIGVTVGMGAGNALLAYELRKHHSRLWWVPTTVGIAAHGYGISTGVKYFEWRFVFP
ncbi:MAG: hypothetical protein WAN35_19770, partial [Terracidiphilus sp.]